MVVRSLFGFGRFHGSLQRCIVFLQIIFICFNSKGFPECVSAAAPLGIRSSATTRHHTSREGTRTGRSPPGSGSTLLSRARNIFSGCKSSEAAKCVDEAGHHGPHGGSSIRQPFLQLQRAGSGGVGGPAEDASPPQAQSGTTSTRTSADNTFRRTRGRIFLPSSCQVYGGAVAVMCCVFLMGSDVTSGCPWPASQNKQVVTLAPLSIRMSSASVGQLPHDSEGEPQPSAPSPLVPLSQAIISPNVERFPSVSAAAPPSSPIVLGKIQIDNPKRNKVEVKEPELSKISKQQALSASAKQMKKQKTREELDEFVAGYSYCNSQKDWGPIQETTDRATSSHTGGDGGAVEAAVFPLAKVTKVISFIRHGARIAAGGAQDDPQQWCWANDPVEFDCDAASSHSLTDILRSSSSEGQGNQQIQNPMSATDHKSRMSRGGGPQGQQHQKLFRELHDSGKNNWHGTCTIGQLTQSGFEMQLANGKRFAEAYRGVFDILPRNSSTTGRTTSGDARRLRRGTPSSGRIASTTGTTSSTDDVVKVNKQRRKKWYLRSDNADFSLRTIRSGEALVTGLLAEIEKRRHEIKRSEQEDQHAGEDDEDVHLLEPIDFHLDDSLNSNIEPNAYTCPAGKALRDGYWAKSPTAKAASKRFEETMGREIRDAVSSDTIRGMPITLQWLDTVVDCLLSHKCPTAGVKPGTGEIPRGFYAENLLERILGLHEDHSRSNNIDHNRSGDMARNHSSSASTLTSSSWIRQYFQPAWEFPKQRVGPFLQEVLQDLETRKDTNFFLYSGHDNGPMVSLLGALEAEDLPADMVWPPFASYINIELIEEGGETTSTKARVIYCGKVLKTKYCEDGRGFGICDAEQLFARLRSLVPTREECGLEQK